MFNEKWIIFKTFAGSRMYGTHTPESDIDIRGVCVPPLKILLDPFSNFEQYEGINNQDITIYSIRKFFQLLQDCNPNIVELLFVSRPIISSLKWRLIVSNSNLFLSRRTRSTFIGYAYSQLKRIKLHREWLLNPPKKKPIRKDYNLPETPNWGFDKLENIIHAPREVIVDEYRDEALREISYRGAKTYWDNYHNWEITRNEKRAILEAKFGYDTKHGMHLYRLLTEGLELLNTGRITLPRPDKDFLLEIRNGGLSYNELMSLTSEFEEKINLAADNSPLPDKPDTNKMRDLYYSLVM